MNERGVGVLLVFFELLSAGEDDGEWLPSKMVGLDASEPHTQIWTRRNVYITCSFYSWMKCWAMETTRICKGGVGKRKTRGDGGTWDGDCGYGEHGLKEGPCGSRHTRHKPA